MGALGLVGMVVGASAVTVEAQPRDMSGWVAADPADMAGMQARASLTRPIDQMIESVQRSSQRWMEKGIGAAAGLFAVLFGIHLAWAAMQLALSEQGTLMGFVAFLVRETITGGFYLALVKFAGSWMPLIPRTMSELAGAMTGQGAMAPQDVMRLGLEVVADGMERGLSMDIGATLIIAIGGFGLLLITAAIAGLMAVALIQMYVVMSAGVIFLGFGGSKWTRPMVETYLRALLAVGVKLMVMDLLVAVTLGQIEIWLQEAMRDATWELMLTVLAALVVVWMMVKSIPDYVAAVLQGSAGHGAGDAAMMGMGMAGMALAGAAAMAPIRRAAETGGDGLRRAGSAAWGMAGAAGAYGLMKAAEAMQGSGSTTTGHAASMFHPDPARSGGAGGSDGVVSGSSGYDERAVQVDSERLPPMPGEGGGGNGASSLRGGAEAASSGEAGGAERGTRGEVGTDGGGESRDEASQARGPERREEDR